MIRSTQTRLPIVAVLLALAALAVAPAVHAQAATPSIQLEQIDCVPSRDNGVIEARIPNGVAGVEPRLYFRWDEHGAFYWVEMQAETASSYWAIPPKPERQNERIEYYADVVDASGRSVGRSETLLTPVERDCEVDLTAEQEGVAENMIVGETVEDQRGESVMGFLCDGIVARVDYRGIRRADEVCRACVIAWWERPEVIIPAAAGLVGAGFVLDDDDEASPSRP